METTYLIKKPYLYFPVQIGKEERLMEIFSVKEEKEVKLTEYKIPAEIENVESFEYNFKGAFPVKEYMGKEIKIRMDASSNYFNAIENCDLKEPLKEKRPKIHFTANSGWTNDPNGLIYKDGIYHFYFQYNPFHIKWDNMTWGHAISTDLIHWQELDSVLFPDKNGTMFSGSAILNTEGKLNLPKDSIVFYYTAAGQVSDWCKDVEFTQRIAYSLDGGKTLQKIPEACIETICSVNRDPKVFYHDKSNAYIMVLWLEEADYGIFRSTDMMHWQMQQKVTIADTWECPDLFCLKVEEGKEKWVFWTASGVYIVGDFDGYTFTQTGGPKNAYISQLPYAAQTYSNIANRVVSIPWLRLDNDGRSYTGSYGIPVEFSLKNTEAGYTLVQKPVRELWQNCEEIEAPLQDSMVIVTKEERELYTFEINETLVSYNAQSGILQVGKETYNLQNGYKEILFILDDNILEMFFDGGISAGSFALNSNQESFSTDISCKFYKIK